VAWNARIPLGSGYNEMEVRNGDLKGEERLCAARGGYKSMKVFGIPVGRGHNETEVKKVHLKDESRLCAAIGAYKSLKYQRIFEKKSQGDKSPEREISRAVSAYMLLQGHILARNDRISLRYHFKNTPGCT
jgi:hypothetical protein